MLEACFVWNGRVGRLAYFGYSLLMGVILVVIGLILVLPTRNSPNGPMVATVAFALLALVAIYAGFCLCAKRLHDLDLHAWHYVWMVLLPSIVSGAGSATHQLALNIVGGLFQLFVGLYLLFWPGTDGTNRFGYRP
jgi:uncharacterized membrane protein YhaH (DUF805 family)